MADRDKRTFADLYLRVLLGCSPVSEGCRYCWAALRAWRYRTSKLYAGLSKKCHNGPSFTGEIRFFERKLNALKKIQYKNVWVAPDSDVFHEKVPLWQIAKIYAAFYRYPTNTYQILTKRIARMHQLYTDGTLKAAVEKELGRRVAWPPPNTWEGTSVENEHSAKTRLPLLVDTPSNYRFISAQPVLERMDLAPFAPKLNYAILGLEAGPYARQPTPETRRALVDARWDLARAGVPQLTICYPQ